MKKMINNTSKFGKHIMVLALLLFVATFAFAAAELPEKSNDIIQTISMILNAVLMVVGYFLNAEKVKAKLDLASLNGKLGDLANIANLKIEQIRVLANKILEAVEDDKITPEELKGIVKAGKDIITL